MVWLAILALAIFMGGWSWVVYDATRSDRWS